MTDASSLHAYHRFICVKTQDDRTKFVTNISEIDPSSQARQDESYVSNE
jgi:hypothetical protein